MTSQARDSTHRDRYASNLVTGGVSNLFARFSPASTSLEARAFLQRRISLFIKMMLCSYVALLVLVNVLYEVYPVTRPARASLINWIALGSMGFAIGFWLLTSRKKTWSTPMLLFFDLAGMLLVSTVFIIAGVLADDKDANSWSAFIWMSFSVFTRGLVVPSSWKRTVLASTIGIAPTLVGSAIIDVEIPTAPLLVGTVGFCLIVVTLSTLGSHVIYGLRAQVHQAMQLGQYTILDKIGEGGMGKVYTARHTMLRRPTAIKLLRPELAGVDSLKRFEREVQLTSELTHPNTIAIYDYGRSPEGLFYYAMEYLDGIDLETLVRDYGPQPWQRVAHVLRQIAGSLEEAHEEGLIHRDIKPSNVILCKRGGIPDVAKVLDFGLVKQINQTEHLTHANMVTGTPAYLPPEAVTRPDDVSAASDLYALGAVGYYLVTGDIVFRGETPVEICMHHVNSRPVPPSQRIETEIPREFDDLLMRCLAKAPGDRPASARELRLALKELASLDEWTEEQATVWWDEFRRGREADQDPHPSCSLTTMTVDVGARTDVNIGSDTDLDTSSPLEHA